MTFTFTMDCFPGYTYFDRTKKVISVLQIAADVAATRDYGKPVMLHQTGDETKVDATGGVLDYDSLA